jgi:hypothetical protein
LQPWPPRHNVPWFTRQVVGRRRCCLYVGALPCKRPARCPAWQAFAFMLLADRWVLRTRGVIECPAPAEDKQSNQICVPAAGRRRPCGEIALVARTIQRLGPGSGRRTDNRRGEPGHDQCSQCRGPERPVAADGCTKTLFLVPTIRICRKPLKTIIGPAFLISISGIFQVLKIESSTRHATKERLTVRLKRADNPNDQENDDEGADDSVSEHCCLLER